MDGTRSALIIASEQYSDPGLQRLRAPASDARALAGVLCDPDIGGFEVRTLLDEPSYVVNLAVEEFFADRQPGDLLLVHFSGHGIKDQNGELYFAASNTVLGRLGATAVAAEFVNRLMGRTRSRRVVLLLDCCYAGAFERGLAARSGPELGIEQQLGGRGRAVITASSAMEYAFESGELTDASDVPPSVFTSALVQGLQTGDADRDQDGLVSLDELYDYVYDRVRAVTPSQTPGKWTFGMEGELYIARRSRPVTTPSALPPELRDAIDSPLAGVRGGAVQELAAMLRGSHAGRVLAARLALEQLTSDDSRAVATAAAAALAASAPASALVTPPPITASATPVEAIPAPATPVEAMHAPATAVEAIHAPAIPAPAIPAEAMHAPAIPVEAVHAQTAPVEPPAEAPPRDDGPPQTPDGPPPVVTAPREPRPARPGRRRAMTAGAAAAAAAIGVIVAIILISSKPHVSTPNGPGASTSVSASASTSASTSASASVPPFRRVAWTFPTGGQIWSSPAVVAGVIYFGSQDGNVYALNATTSKLLWKSHIGAMVQSSPAVAGGVVYIGSDNGTVYGLNAANGHVRWSDTIGGMVMSSPAVSSDGSVVYVGSTNGNVYALDTLPAVNAVRQIWVFHTQGGLRSGPVVAGGVVYVGSEDGSMYGLNASTGGSLWSYPTGGWVVPNPTATVVAGVVYFGSHDGNLYAVSAGGKLIWKYPAGGHVDSRPAVANGIVYVGSDDYYVYALNTRTNPVSLLWRKYVGNFVVSGAAVAGGVVYLGSGDGNVYALDAATGNIRWSYSTGKEIFSCPVVSGKMVYVGSEDGKMYAFNTGS